MYILSLQAMVDLQEKAAEHNISIIAAESFLGDPEAQVENIEVTFLYIFNIFLIIYFI